MDDGPPPGVDRVRCSRWTKDQEPDPIGSAGTYRRFVLVATPLPWPRDIGEHPVLGQLVPAAGTRILAVTPEVTIEPAHAAYTVWHRSGTHRWEGIDYRCAPERLVDRLRALLDPTAVHPNDGVPAPPEVLICSHGRRDVCCGGAGAALHRTVRHRWPGVRVRRCSHTGGHRYAPTGLTFPDGRWCAYLDPSLLDRIVRRGGAVADLHDHQRGCTDLDPWAQVVERALFERAGWPWLGYSLDEVDVLADDTEAPVQLRWSEPTRRYRAQARVRVVRRLPVPDCGAPLDQARDTSAERSLVDLKIAEVGR